MMGSIRPVNQEERKFVNTILGKTLIKSLILVAIFIIVNSGAPLIVTGAQNSHDLVWQAVINYLSWQKYWYGTFFGENCFNRLKEKKVSVFFMKISPESEYSRKLRCLNCDFTEKAVKSESMMVVIADSVLQYSIIDRQNNCCATKPRATIIPPYDINDQDICSPVKEQKMFFDRYATDSHITVVRDHRLIKGLGRFVLPEIKANRENDTVIRAVQRTMSNYLKYYYFEKDAPGKRSTISNEVLEKVKKNKTILLGRFKDSDPYLLVYYPGDNNVYYLDFPPVEMLRENNCCMEVFRDSYYMSPDLSNTEKQIIQVRFLEKLKANSNEIELLGKEWGH